MRANQQIHGMKSTLASCGLRMIFVVALSMGMLVASAESRSVFGGRTVAAALFGKNEKETGTERPPIHSPFGKPRNPPPPPPGRPPMPTTPADQQQQTNAATDRTVMPPPPPPKPDDDPSKEARDEALAAESSTETAETVAANPQESTPPAIEGSQKNEPWSQQQQQQQQQQKPWGGAWENDPQYAQQQQQQPYYAGDAQYNNQQWPTIEQQLGDSINREYMLASQVQNLTETIRAVQSQDQLHTRQMDVLTERIMEAEAQIAHEHNAALEYQTNCTEMARQIAVLHDELLDWQSRCAGFADQHKVSETTIKELKKDLKEARAEAENLAISIENSRIRDHMDGSSLTKKKKSRGLLGWIFSFLVSSSSSSSSSETEVDRDVENPQALAKSTLLKALQIERNNVDELDAFVASLQQNNSAIAEMVKSRDLIIDELNERVAVFEEDKVVLKAALKQLQKEMKEEAPKSQKMLDDFEAASQEVTRLNAEIASIIEMHENEISALLQSISQKQSAINASETKHSEIGRYVDMLEERLANFSITRRDLEVRERSCKEAEALAEQMEGERDNLRSKIAELETERNDFKSLFEELGQELASLREENGRLIDEKEALEKGAQRSREALASLENNMKRLDQESEKWKIRTTELQRELKSTKAETTDIQGGVNETKTQNENLKKHLASLRVLNSELLEQIEVKTAEASSAQEQIVTKSTEVAKKEEMLKRKVDELSENGAKLKAVSAKLQELEETIQKKTAEQKEALQGKPKGSRSRGPFSGKKDEPPSQIDKAAGVSAKPVPDQNITSVQPPQKVGNKDPLTIPGRAQQPLPEKGAQQAKKRRKVPLRRIRKVFSRVTGIHNAFTRPSEKGTLKGPPPAQQKDPNPKQKRKTKMPSEQQQKRAPPLQPPSQQSSPQDGVTASDQQRASPFEPGIPNQKAPPNDGVTAPGQQQRRASPLQPGGPNQYLPSREGMGAPGQQQQQQRRSPPWLQSPGPGSAQPPEK